MIAWASVFQCSLPTLMASRQRVAFVLERVTVVRSRPTDFDFDFVFFLFFFFFFSSCSLSDGLQGDGGRGGCCVLFYAVWYQ